MLINSRLKRKIESIRDYKGSYSIKLKDIDDTFWFSSETDLYDFINRQASERFYDKEPKVDKKFNIIEISEFKEKLRELI